MYDSHVVSFGIAKKERRTGAFDDRALIQVKIDCARHRSVKHKLYQTQVCSPTIILRIHLRNFVTISGSKDVSKTGVVACEGLRGYFRGSVYDRDRESCFNRDGRRT